MLQKIILKLRKSVWLVPAAYCLMAFALAIFVIFLDTRRIGSLQDSLPSYLFTNVSLAKDILSTIAVALLTMITFTFSTMMIVLTMYSSQFSPRILPNFLTDRKSTTVLGVFMGSFVYAILSFFFISQHVKDDLVVSATIGILLVLVCLAFFIYFIYHVTASIQVKNLIKKLYNEEIKTINNYKKNLDSEKFTHVDKLEFKKTYFSKVVTASGNGYIQAIDHEGLLEDAEKSNRLIQVKVKLGKYVIEGENLAIVHELEGLANEKDYEEIRGKIVIGDERSASQDVEYGLSKMVDIALRAISPGINDPNTAIETINVIGLVLGEISDYTGDKIMVKDVHDIPRLVMEGIDFEELLYTTFYQLRHHGSEDISVVLSMIDALIIAAHKSPPNNKKLIWSFHTYIIEIEDHKTIKEMDKRYLKRQIYKLNKVCNIQ